MLIAFVGCNTQKSKDDPDLKIISNANRAIQKLDTLLLLSDEQRDKLFPHALESARHIEQFKKNSKNYTLRQKADSVNQMTQSFENALNTICTKEQREVYQRYKAQNRERNIKKMQEQLKEEISRKQ